MIGTILEERLDAGNDVVRFDPRVPRINTLLKL